VQSWTSCEECLESSPVPTFLQLRQHCSGKRAGGRERDLLSGQPALWIDHRHAPGR
jgi:hypothetical protein